MNNTTNNNESKGATMDRNEAETKVLNGMDKVREMQCKGELNFGMIHAHQVAFVSGIDVKIVKNALKRLERKGKVASVTAKGRHSRGGLKVTSYRKVNK